MQSQAEVIWLCWGLSEVVRSPEQLPPTDLSVIHLVKMWHTAGGLCLWSISANKKQLSLSGLSCPPACSLVSAVSSCLKGAGNCTALSDAPQMAFPYKPQWDRKGKDTPGLQSSRISLQHLKNPIWSENGYMFTKHHWPFPILEDLEVGPRGFEPKPETIEALFALSLIPLCSFWTLTECTAEMHWRG